VRWANRSNEANHALAVECSAVSAGKHLRVDCLAQEDDGMPKTVSLRPLVAATLANYAAQVPYFIHNDYTPQQPLPNLYAATLLGGTLIWFLVGLRGFLTGRRWGLAVLLSFVTVEALFYAKTFVTGHVTIQLQNPSDLVRAVFVIGYISGAVAAVYAFLLLRGYRNWSAAG
jgi:hypothetical protein